MLYIALIAARYHSSVALDQDFWTQTFIIYSIYYDSYWDFLGYLISNICPFLFHYTYIIIRMLQ